MSTPKIPFERRRPLSADEMKPLREKQVKVQELAADVKFTCDGCSYAPKCELAFDSYNTNGDCLLDK